MTKIELITGVIEIIMPALSDRGWEDELEKLDEFLRRAYDDIRKEVTKEVYK